MRSLPIPSLSVPLLLAAIGGALLPDCRAQCGLQWQPGAPASGPAGTVWASAVLPNGDLVVGGEFALADAAPAVNIARWNGSTWLPLGDGLDGIVYALAVLPNGDLLAGGSFQNSGTTPLDRIARWNGTSWSAIGSGLIGTVRAIQAMPNGDIVIGGALSIPGSTVNNGMALWDGSSWSAIGPDLFTGYVRSIARLSNGDLLFGGLFVSFGPGPVQTLARWDGVRWTQEPGLGAGSAVEAIVALPLGQYALAGGLFIDGISTGVVRFDGTSLVALAAPSGTYQCLATDNAGNLIAGGSLVFGGGGLVARFDGSRWTVLPAGAPHNTRSLRVEPNGDVLACGSAGMSGGIEGSSVRRFDGASWSLLGRPQPPRIDALVQLPGGDIVAGGAFSSLGGIAAANIARWNGSQWSPLGQGTDGPVTGLAADEQGNVVASGSFARAGGSAANRIAMWTGSAWSTLGNGLPSPANRLAINGQGEVMASGFDNVVRWFAGGRWTPFTPLLSVTSIIADANGDFLFGGVSATPPLVAVVRFSAGTTSPEPSGLILARSLVRLRDGSIVAAGNGVQGSNIVRLQGGTWAPFSAQGFPTSTVVAVTELANGQVLAAGGNPMLLARYDGSAWVTVGSVERLQLGPALSALTASSRGEIFVAGQFEYVDGVLSVGFARATPLCPAAAVPVGAGCFGGGGPVSLAAQTLPWAGATFDAIASGIAMPSVALHVAGIVPASQPLPFGAPGCTLHVDPLFVELLLPTAARLPVTLPVPDHPAILGQILRSQVGLLELSATGGIVRATGTNALQLQVGAF